MPVEAADTLFARIGLDLGPLERAAQNIEQKMSGVSSSLTALGGTLSKSVTAPLAAATAAVVKFSVDLNEKMGNVQSLGLASERVAELKSDVRALAIETGQATGAISEGLYEVVSAFGDSAETAQLLAINSKAAKAGLAEVSDAAALTSAVTKAYGDTSAAAVQQAADLAFQTVKLGQTDFPKLAASLGKVTPLAAELGVTQEELFGSMATLTGVTGEAAEVSTQLRAAYQAVLKPTADMALAISQVSRQLDEQGALVEDQFTAKWKSARATHEASIEELGRLQVALANTSEKTKEGAKRAKELKRSIKEQEKAVKDNYDAVSAAAAALGKSIVSSVGATDAFALLTATAEGNTDTLGKMFGSVEAVTAQLALSGGQADTYRKKLAAMEDVSGAATAAFEAQTQGINAFGFAIDQRMQKGVIVMQTFGDAVSGSLGRVVLPLVDKALGAFQGLADTFRALSPETQDLITKMGLAAAVLGPVALAIGAIASPAVLAAGAVAGLAAGAVLLYEKWEPLSAWFGELWSNVSTIFSSSLDLLTGYVSGFWLKTKEFFTQGAADLIAPFAKFLDFIGADEMSKSISEFSESLGGIVTEEDLAAHEAQMEAFASTFKDATDATGAQVSEVARDVSDTMTGMVSSITSAFTGASGVGAVVDQGTAEAAEAATANLQQMNTDVSDILADLNSDFDAAFGKVDDDIDELHESTTASLVAMAKDSKREGKSIGAALGEGLSPELDKVTGTFNDTFDGIFGGAGDLRKGLNAFTNNGFDGLINKVSGLSGVFKGGFVDKVGGLLSAAGPWGMAISGGISILKGLGVDFDKVADGIKNGIVAAGKAIGQVFGKIGSFMGDVGKKIFGFYKGVFSKIGDVISAPLRGVRKLLGFDSNKKGGNDQSAGQVQELLQGIATQLLSQGFTGDLRSRTYDFVEKLVKNDDTFEEAYHSTIEAALANAQAAFASGERITQQLQGTQGVFETMVETIAGQLTQDGFSGNDLRQAVFDNLRSFIKNSNSFESFYHSNIERILGEVAALQAQGGDAVDFGSLSFDTSLLSGLSVDPAGALVPQPTMPNQTIIVNIGNDTVAEHVIKGTKGALEVVGLG